MLAFTLAEVLITLGIIGVVAAMTIPTLVNNYQKTQYVVKLKKVYSMLSQVFILIQTDAGGSILSDSSVSQSTTGYTEAANYMQAFTSRMKTIKTCPNAGGDCWYTTPIYYLDHSLGNYKNNADLAQVRSVLSDGTMLMFWQYGNNCTGGSGTAGSPLDGKVCGAIAVDVNGISGPNTEGRDVFFFFVAQTGIYPWGISYDTGSPASTTCISTGNGDGCAGKVLLENAMNY